MKLIMCLAALFLPNDLKILFYKYVLKYKIGNNVKIGLSILMVKNLTIGNYSRIGNFTVIKGLELVDVGDYSSIGSLNWITGFPIGTGSRHFSSEANRVPSLIIGNNSAITARHIIDCTSQIKIGNYTTFAGWRSQMMTHSINLEYCEQRSLPIVIGDYCFIGTKSTILGGSVVPNNCVVAANSMYALQASEEWVIYGGVPAKKIKSIPKNWKYFNREHGFVW